MQKSIYVDGVDQPVILSRRKGTRNLRISLKSDGKVQLSVPYGVPEFAARSFIKSKVEWINNNLKHPSLITDNSHIGKSHRLSIVPSNASRHSTKVTDTDIVVKLPSALEPNDAEAQKIIKKACDKALLLEAERLLPQRLEQISTKTGIDYNEFTVKKLKSRWGACDSHKNITLNSYLIQLDWDLIDYVITHELAHTHHQHHQKDFWDYVASLSPDYKLLRKQLKSQPTDIIPTNF